MAQAASISPAAEIVLAPRLVLPFYLLTRGRQVGHSAFLSWVVRRTVGGAACAETQAASVSIQALPCPCAATASRMLTRRKETH